ncbi:PARP-domain-containing protein [Coniophora puteana RWD-64-598 SS2]|uniref:Poly [ADP-ribose] polymerase n=1 Tax=Coniophora puteana (strain RWD-64-598) TaxID=741705 RepID=A0A5M3N5L1_CONPW|nr:PARP-domain-containing protein [Coniophora puteana RWD-64-598 SS2]EIW86354.1 PARP-domain-containing protein [Coniophora puteana RWD-64-598 SS2]
MTPTPMSTTRMTTRRTPRWVTVVKRGAAPVDPESGYVATHQVYNGMNTVWDAMLNQTEVGSNKNKFYVIQVLHPAGNDNQCFMFTRWGRVGERGQSKSNPLTSPTGAVSDFKKQFRAKSGVAWESRHGMVAGKGKYTWLERSFEDESDDKKDDNAEMKDSPPIAASKLHPNIQTFCNFIFNARLIDATLSSMNYDANKLPLGKLAKNTILQGFAALKRLAEAIDQPNGDLAKSMGGLANACQELTSQYYSIIPHVFGRTRPTVINNAVALKKELDLVDALGDMQISHEVLNTALKLDEDGNLVNPVDSQYASLGLTSMDPVDQGTSEFARLAAYVRDTHGETHSNISASIVNAFRVERATETEAWNNAGFDKLAAGERMLLWHGSRSTNFAGILSQGLRIAPPEAPVTGYMFGKGVYFADIMTKSANYCHSYLSDNIGVMLLCEVAAKPFLELNDSSYTADADCKAAKKLATKGVGRTQPTEWEDAAAALNHPELGGCHIPQGKPSNVNPDGAWLQYNEYIVYDPAQIRLRYLLMVKMR